MSHVTPSFSPQALAVLQAAQALLERTGPRFRMQDLAIEAGVSRATLYRLFPSRSLLLKRLQQQGTVDLGLLQDDTRARILGAVRVVLRRVGFEGATIEAIASEAGLTPMTVFRHFPSRERLLRAFVNAYSPRSQARSLAVSEGEDPEAALSELAAKVLSFLQQNTDLLRLVIGASEEQRKRLRRLRDAPRGTTVALTNYFRRQIRAGRLRKQNPEDLAIAFTGLLVTFGYLAPQFQDRALTDPQATGQFLARLFLRGVQVPARKGDR